MSFDNLGLRAELLNAVKSKGYTTPTPIQARVIPAILAGRDILARAQTGTGKTDAFALPLVDLLSRGNPHRRHPRALILAPTRELALQVGDSIKAYGRRVSIRCSVVYGGVNIDPQIDRLKRGIDILVATPGRLLDLAGHRDVNLSRIEFLVFDEADRMLDLGFSTEISEVLALVPEDRRTMLFSATMPEDIVRIAANYMKLPVRVEIARPGTAADKITHELFVITREAKNLLLEKLLTDYRGSTLVFCRTKFNAKKVTRAVQTMGHRSAEIHSNRSLAQRREALDGFKSGRYRVLVATDIAARGIDVTGIELVINYDLPSNPGDYVHRIGRTGRAGLSGRAISFATPDQRSEVREIEKLVRIMLPPSRLPTFPPRQPTQMGEKHTAHQTRGAQYSHSGHSRRPPHRQYR